MSDDEHVEGKDEEFEAHKLQPGDLGEPGVVDPGVVDPGPGRADTNVEDDDFEGHLLGTPVVVEKNDIV